MLLLQQHIYHHAGVKGSTPFHNSDVIAQLEEHSPRCRFESCFAHWVNSSTVEHYMANVEEEVRRFLKNGDPKIKARIIYQQRNIMLS